MHFFEKSEYFSNLLIINILHTNLPFPYSKFLKNPLTFKFLFRHFSKVGNYTLLHILIETNCFFLRSPQFLSFQRAVFKFSAHSAENCSALEIKLQCAVKKKTVRWKFKNLVLFSKKLFAGNKQM